MNRRSLLTSAALALVARQLPAWTTGAAAETASPVWRHGASPFGDLKYPTGFARFDYVNAKAPKGGSARQIALGTFDNFNPVVGMVKGALVQGTDLLYDTLLKFGFARGHYQARPDDGLELIDCRITNAVRCVPPENKPTPQEIATCRPFLTATIAEMPRLRAVIALGRIAHETMIVARDLRKSLYPFTHGRAHAMGEFKLFDSYHCSRYNTNTGVLTPQMFREVFALVREHLDAA